MDINRLATTGKSSLNSAYSTTSGEILSPPLDESKLRALFTKAYGQESPSIEQWRALYADDVHFIDPTQERYGIEAYINAQQSLAHRCDDIFLKARNIAVQDSIAFVEWEMGLKIRGIEFIYPGATRLDLGADGRITGHRDYFDFIGPTLGPVPVLGRFIRWLYRQLVS